MTKGTGWVAMESLFGRGKRRVQWTKWIAPNIKKQDVSMLLCGCRDV